MQNIQALRAFFKKCSFINVGIFIISFVVLVLFNGPIIALHSQLLNIDPADLPILYVQHLGFYKLLILIFNVVPYFALRWIN